MFQESLEGVGQNLVRAVPDEHLLGRHIVMGSDRLAQSESARIRIEAQTIGCGSDRSQRVRRRRVRILVGIELDDAILPWLLAGHIWRQVLDDRTPETAHDLRPNGGSDHRRTGRAWAEVRRNSPPPDAAAVGTLQMASTYVSRRVSSAGFPAAVIRAPAPVSLRPFSRAHAA